MTTAQRRILLIALILLMEGLMLAVLLTGQARPWMFYAAGIAGSALWLTMIPLLRAQHGMMWGYMLIATGMILRLTVLAVEPVASDDMYRYIWDGKTQYHGYDAFAHAPADEKLRHLRSEMLPARINFPEMRTVYPPLAQWLFHATYAVFGESIAGFKVPLFIAEIASLLLIILLLRRFELPPALTGIYALHPLPILQFMVDGHLDALAFPFVLLFLLLCAQRRRFLAPLALGASVAVKLLSAIYVPLLIRDAWRQRRAWFLLALILPALAYIPSLLAGGAPFESLGAYTMNWTFNGSVFRLLHAATDSNQTARLILMALTAAGLLILGFRQRPMIWKMPAATVLFFFLAATVHPWYLTWLAVLLPFYPRWSFLVFTATVAVANWSGMHYTLTGEWAEPLWIGLATYLPVYTVLVLEWAGIIPLPDTPRRIPTADPTR